LLLLLQYQSFSCLTSCKLQDVSYVCSKAFNDTGIHQLRLHGASSTSTEILVPLSLKPRRSMKASKNVCFSNNPPQPFSLENHRKGPLFYYPSSRTAASSRSDSGETVITSLVITVLNLGFVSISKFNSKILKVVAFEEKTSIFLFR